MPERYREGELVQDDLLKSLVLKRPEPKTLPPEPRKRSGSKPTGKNPKHASARKRRKE